MKLKITRSICSANLIFFGFIVFLATFLWIGKSFAETNGVSTFSFGAKLGTQYMSSLNLATFNHGTLTPVVRAEGSKATGEYVNGIYPYLRVGVTKNLGLETMYGYERGGQGVSLSTFSESVVYILKEHNINPYTNIRHYIKAGVVVGQFSTDKLAGKFKRGAGYQGGLGVELGGQKVAFIIECMYRSISFKYYKDTSSKNTVESDNIALTSFGLTAGLVVRY